MHKNRLGKNQNFWRGLQHILRYFYIFAIFVGSPSFDIIFINFPNCILFISDFGTPSLFIIWTRYLASSLVIILIFWMETDYMKIDKEFVEHLNLNIDEIDER